jgi:hypothetical protein
MSQGAEEFIETVDIRQLHERDSQILRLFAVSFLDRLAFGRYQRRLLATGRWERLRAEPRRDGESGASSVFDLYGTPFLPGSGATPRTTRRRA